MRLAVYGPISASGGSTATAFFRLVETWVNAGHAVDFYSPGTWINVDRLLARPGFRYFAVELARSKQVREFTPASLPTVPRKALEGALSELQFFFHEREIAAAIRTQHALHRYDALVVLNTLSGLPLENELPVVSFPQGPPEGESEFVKREPRLVREECGWFGWAVVRGAYLVRDPRIARTLGRSHMIVVSSGWARQMFRRVGVPDERTAVLFPPVELERFRASPRPANPEDFRFLWLGRIVPRKRFPLALAAFELLRRRRPGARLTVIGSHGYGGFVRPRTLQPLGVGVIGEKSIPHEEVPSLLARTDVILQPSENENFGGAAAEGLACGVPTVLGPTNGTADALEAMAFRFDRYEPPAVADAMARAMDAVLADPAAIARRARGIAERTLDLTKTAERAADLIADVAARWRGGCASPGAHAALVGEGSIALERAGGAQPRL
jgi:glycosyltransferase involved in cell wall biosynthesis